MMPLFGILDFMKEDFMDFASDTIEERYIFGYEERKAALKRSGGICACCGKKLTTKTMTMDHIVPISRGGTNESENLIALCEVCNKQKGNMLYMPVGYYKAMENKSELLRMEKHVEKWFATVKEQFDIEKFPLIAPITNVQVSPSNFSNKKKQVYIPQAIFRWQIVSRDCYEEIEAVTEINIREIRTKLPTVHYLTNVTAEDGYLPTVALYSFRKMTTDKIIAVIAIQFLKEQQHINIWMPWCEAPGKWQGSLLYNLVSILLDTIERIAGYEIAHYTIVGSTKYEHTVHDFVKAAIKNPFLGDTFSYKEAIEKKKGKHSAEFLYITRKKDKIEETLESVASEFSKEHKKHIEMQ